MKKPVISLAAVERIDALPLRKALELHQKASAEIVAARQRETALAKEVGDYLAGIDPNDEKAVSLVAGKKIQQEVLPRLIAKVESQVADEMAPALLREADQFRGDLIRFYTEARETVAQQLAAIFRPFFSPQTNLAGEQVDRALEIARQSDDCVRVYARQHEAERISLPTQPRSNDPARHDRELVEAARALLVLAERS